MKNNKMTKIALGMILLTLVASCATEGNSNASYSGTVSGFITDKDAKVKVADNTTLYSGVNLSYQGSTLSSTTYNLANTTVDITLTEDSLIVLTGSTNEQVKINTAGFTLLLTLDNVNINNALSITKAGTTYLTLVGDNKVSADSSLNEAISVKGDLILNGSGSLVINTYYDGLVVKNHLFFLEGTVDITIEKDTTVSDKGTAIKVTNGYVQDGGKLVINGNNSTSPYESRGIKVKGDESTGTGEGYVIINGGEIEITTYGKAISAGWDIDEDATTVETTDDPSPDVYINNGLITITTLSNVREDTATLDGVSPEGIEGKNNVYINGGKLVINTTDDAINAGNMITITGGLIYARSSQNDAIDAGGEENQGILNITGGTIIALGTSRPEMGIDCNSDQRFTYTGGTIVALGGGNNIASSSSTTGFMVQYGAELTSGQTVALLDSSNQLLALFTLPGNYSASNLLVASSSLTSTGCSIVTGAWIETSDTTFEGMSFSSVTINGGTSLSPTLSSGKVYKAGTTTSFGGMRMLDGSQPPLGGKLNFTDFEPPQKLN